MWAAAMLRLGISSGGPLLCAKIDIDSRARSAKRVEVIKRHDPLFGECDEIASVDQIPTTVVVREYMLDKLRMQYIVRIELHVIAVAFEITGNVADQCAPFPSVR